MMKLAAIGALGVMASCLYSQGLNPGGQTKDDWEEINFEFNSSILSDGYPSLLRLAELLGQHKDYRVKVTGHTDYVGSAAYNDKLGMQRAEAVKAFLVKYGAAPAQITTAGDGKRSPEVDNKTKEGRFMNRRVVLAVTDGQGKLIKEGGISEVVPALNQALLDFMKKQEDCCEQILKRLDKLDDILAALKNLQGENDKLRGDLAQLRNEHNMLRDQVAAIPKPLTEQQTQKIADTAATGALDEAARRNKKFSLLGLNIGPAFGPSRTGDFTFTGRGQFFSPFGGDGTHAVQAQGEFMYYPGRKEGQFDIGLVNRFGNLQAGGFASFKVIDFAEYQDASWMGQAAFMLDYLFRGGRIGAFITRGFKNYAVLNSVTLAPGAYLQTFARVVNQQGVNFLFAAWGNAYFQGDVAYLKMREDGRNSRPGVNLKLIQPFTPHVAFTAEGSYNETLISKGGSGALTVGLEVGNYTKPKEFAEVKHPVPMDVPRIRYEFGTRRVGSSPPIADAGPDQIGIPAGTVTLNGSGSYDPLGLPLTYQWTQIAGPPVTLANASAVTTTFTGAAGQTYSFRLTVKNTDNLTGTARTTVSIASPAAVRIVQFTAIPATIQPGQQSTLSWVVDNANSVSISPGIGNVDARSGSVSVSPTQTTTYTLTATNANGSVNASQTVTVGAAPAGNPQIIRFEANPVSIAPGQSSTLSWTTTGASTVTISQVGSVAVNGSTTVTPAQTTTYTLTATSSDGKSVTAPVTVIVAPANIPQIVTFVANPPTIDAGTSTKLCWQVNNATNITITPGVGTNLNANDCATVSPTTTTTYTLTAVNAAGMIQANATVTVGQVRIVSFTSDPIYSVYAGTPVLLSWQTQNALSVVIVGNELPPQSLAPTGTLTVYPTTNTTYTLTAYGPSGQTVSVTISVFVR
ncbi:MAG TPA: OmpA family protein [Bryobacteraceae bacterium]|nr:OmpA family protein [Bryobacteraceae bacterium]